MPFFVITPILLFLVSFLYSLRLLFILILFLFFIFIILDSKYRLGTETTCFHIPELGTQLNIICFIMILPLLLPLILASLLLSIHHPSYSFFPPTLFLISLALYPSHLLSSLLLFLHLLSTSLFSHPLPLSSLFLTFSLSLLPSLLSYAFLTISPTLFSPYHRARSASSRWLSVSALQLMRRRVCHSEIFRWQMHHLESRKHPDIGYNYQYYIFILILFEVFNFTN